MAFPNNDVSITPGSGEVVETFIQPDGAQRQGMHVADFKVALSQLLAAISNPIHVNNAAQMRVTLENIGTGLTLGTVTTVGGVTLVTTVSTVTSVTAVVNLQQIGGFKADSMILDNMASMWANCLRGRIQ